MKKIIISGTQDKEVFYLMYTSPKGAKILQYIRQLGSKIISQFEEKSATYGTIRYSTTSPLPDSTSILPPLNTLSATYHAARRFAEKFVADHTDYEIDDELEKRARFDMRLAEELGEATNTQIRKDLITLLNNRKCQLHQANLSS